jgi:hypothetical protein
VNGCHQQYGLERQVEPLVMASEISGLASLRGYLKVGNLVVRLTFPFIDLPKNAPPLIERPPRPHRAEGGIVGAADAPASAARQAHDHPRQGQGQDLVFGSLS